MFLFYLWRKTDANVLVTLRRLCKQWWNSQICPLWADQSRKDLTFWTIIELSFKICRWKCYDLGSKLTQNISTRSFVTIWTIYFLFCFFSNCTDMGQYSHFTVLWMKYHCAMTINIYLVRLSSDSSFFHSDLKEAGIFINDKKETRPETLWCEKSFKENDSERDVRCENDGWLGSWGPSKRLRRSLTSKSPFRDTPDLLRKLRYFYDDRDTLWILTQIFVMAKYPARFWKQSKSFQTKTEKCNKWKTVMKNSTSSFLRPKTNLFLTLGGLALWLPSPSFHHPRMQKISQQNFWFWMPWRELQFGLNVVKNWQVFNRILLFGDISNLSLCGLPCSGNGCFD